MAGIFGYAVFRADLTPDEPKCPPDESYAKKVCEAAAGNRAFCYSKIPVERVDQVAALAQIGFVVVDVNITFERKPASEEAQPTGSPVTIRNCVPADEPAVLGIAERSFVYSRFHLDPAIPVSTANAVKREWVRNYILGKRGDRLLVAEIDGKIAGFLAVLAAEQSGEAIGVIDLIAVGKPFQGHGFGKALVDRFVRSGAGRFSRLVVGTQGANGPSCRLYETAGFRFSRAAYVLHAHMFDGVPSR